MMESYIKTVNFGRGEGEGLKTFLVPLGHVLMHVNLFSGVPLMTKYCHKNKPIWNIWNHMVSMATHYAILKNEDVEQFVTHEKLSPTSTIHVNCMKHDPIDLIYNFMLSKALLIHIYIVSIWCITSFTIHLAWNKCLYANNFRLNLGIYRQDCDSAYSAPIQHDTGKNKLCLPKVASLQGNL